MTWLAVNVLSLHVLLEHARTVDPNLRIVYAELVQDLRSAALRRYR